MTRRSCYQPDPYWELIQANYSEAELYAYARWAEAMERLERERQANGWSRRVD